MSLSVKRPEKVVQLCLDAALRAEWEALTKRLADEMKRPVQDDRLNQVSGAKDLARQVGEIEDRMAAETVEFTLRGMRRNDWAQKVAAHPPRKGDTADAQYQINTATFFDDVLAASIVDVTRAGSPIVFDPASEWSALADEMTNGQYSEFVDAVLELNRGAVGVPFSRAAASLRSPDSSGTSN